jgi:hypothetical protein
MRTLISILILLLFSGVTGAQTVTQVIRGKVYDKNTQAPLPGASITVAGTVPLAGASSDLNGNFTIPGIPVGRHSIRVTFVGYEPLVLEEVLVSSSREVVLNIGLQESVNAMKEIVVKAEKSQTINSMTTVSARQISMEEASRYAGGYNDPARLASSFAGVAGSLGNNGIVIRGNAPKGLSWRMEGVPIPDPSHFANVSSLGAGAITALSDQVMANSDFLTGAFPAEYGDALSGVFDIRLRNGNAEHREYAAQLGLSGIAASGEGPFVKGKSASYLFNYRFSLFDLLAPILPPEMGKLRYQDLSFKLNFPAGKAGTFSVWGIGALDYQGRDALDDSTAWKYDADREQYRSNLSMFAIGINHRITAGRNTWISTTLSATGNTIHLDQQRYDREMILKPWQEVDNIATEFSLSGFLNHKFSGRHTNRTGYSITRMDYTWLIRQADSSLANMTTFTDDKGNSWLIQAYSQSKIVLPGNITLNVGIHGQYFTLNGHWSLEPRAGISWNITPRQTIGLAYGLHSMTELLNFYLAQVPCRGGFSLANKNLNFSRAHHLVLSYDIRLGDHTHLKIEPWYQRLYDIPVKPGSWYSLLNLDKGVFFNDSLVNDGKGENFGMDVTLEQYIYHGFYYLVTGSVFSSHYCGGDGIWRNSRFNRNYVVNLIGGKEWKTGKKKNNLFSVNARLCLMGGDFETPVNTAATYAMQEIVEDGSQAFTQRLPAAQILSLSLNYRINRRKHASIWEFSFINVLGYKEVDGYYFDRTSQTILQDENQLVIPNLSYRIEF